MKLLRFALPVFILIYSCALHAALPAITQPIHIESIKNYHQYSKPVKALIAKAKDLSQKNLTYMYGSSDPHNGGMDCSGTMYYLLTKSMPNKTIPRDADEIYNWLSGANKLHRVTSSDVNSHQFNHLKPGDLLFWSGTYHTNRNISHVMMYLGTTNDNKPVMFGASDGRTYQGKRMRGVSIFDFVLPKSTDKAKFVGYGCVPNLTC